MQRTPFSLAVLMTLGLAALFGVIVLRPEWFAGVLGRGRWVTSANTSGSLITVSTTSPSRSLWEPRWSACLPSCAHLPEMSQGS